jgi:hypothetical protein
MREALMPYPVMVLDLFDGETPPPDPPTPPAATPPTPAPAPPVRDDAGRFASAEETRRALEASNRENAERRKENNALKKSVDAFSRRAIRSEAKAALIEAGVIDSDVLDVFLKHAGDKIKLDDDAEVVGIADALTAFKTAKPIFFKAADPAPPANETPEQKAAREQREAEEKRKKNATATGGSPAGGGSGEGAPAGGLPDLRKLNPAERKKAIDEYTRSQNVNTRR